MFYFQNAVLNKNKSFTIYLQDLWPFGATVDLNLYIPSNLLTGKRWLFCRSPAVLAPLSEMV